jgi:hypothetical protein
LFAKHPVLLAKLFDHLKLAVIHPSGNSDQYKPEWIQNSRHLVAFIGGPGDPSPEPYIQQYPVSGPYGVRSRCIVSVGNQGFLLQVPCARADLRELRSHLPGFRVVPRSLQSPHQLVEHCRIVGPQLQRSLQKANGIGGFT